MPEYTRNVEFSTRDYDMNFVREGKVMRPGLDHQVGFFLLLSAFRVPVSFSCRMADSFTTIRRAITLEPPRIQGSRFIGDAIPASGEVEALAALEEVRQREPSATHHCWSYRLGTTGNNFRTSDDGEPTGTAGLPILRQIDGRGLTDVLVVVTRYYGGTKLGAGGLMRAYADTAREVLAAAEPVEKVVRVPVRLTFDYGDTAPAMQTLHRFDADIAEQSYTAETELLVRVRRSECDALIAAFTDALGGRGRIAVE